MSFGVITDAIVEVGGLAQLRELDLGDIGDWDISGTRSGDLAAVAKLCPRLERVRWHAGDITIGGDIDLPHLHRLAVETGGLSSTDLAQILEIRAPKLASLDLWFGQDDYGGNCTIEHLAPLLSGSLFPALTHLGLMNCPWIDFAIDALAKAPLLARLTSLDLSMGALTDAGFAKLVEHRDAFAHLANLDITDNALTDAVRPDALRPGLVLGRQDPERVYIEDKDDPDAGSRYSAVGE